MNTAAAAYSVVSGGLSNRAYGSNSTVLGGSFNQANGDDTLAFGFQAVANQTGCMVFSDATSNPTTCNVANPFVVRAHGGFYLFSGGLSDGNYSGAYLAPGSNAWSTVSDRDAKENIDRVDAVAVLDKLAAIPLSTWNWKSQDPGIHHMGPMAQDFYAAFGLGEDEKRINTVDADGVAFAAIQGLNAKFEAKLAEQARAMNEHVREIADQARIMELQAREIAELRRVVETLMTRASGNALLAKQR